MVKLSICILFYIIGIQAVHAQMEKEDSLRLKRMLEGKEEIKINEEAVKSIQFNFLPEEELHFQRPIASEEKSWMKFNTKLPDEFIKKKRDSLQIKFDLKLEIPQRTSAPLATFDADKFLYENFTKRGRAIKHNREHANAWKTYNDYKPAHKDSLDKWEKEKRTQLDTLAFVTDTLK